MFLFVASKIGLLIGSNLFFAKFMSLTLRLVIKSSSWPFRVIVLAVIVLYLFNFKYSFFIDINQVFYIVAGSVVFRGYDVVCRTILLRFC